MIDLNPIEKYVGRRFTVTEAANVQRNLYKTASTGSNWYWADINGNEVVDTRIISAARSVRAKVPPTPPTKREIDL